MAATKCTRAASVERVDLASVAAGQLETICLSLMAQSAPDDRSGRAPNPIPWIMLYEIAARGRDLSHAIMNALGDDVVYTAEIAQVVRSCLGTYGGQPVTRQTRQESERAGES